MQDRYLRIYLRDHSAMAQGGLDFMERIRRENKDNIIGRELGPIVGQLHAERRMLRRVMELLHVDRAPLKIAGMRLAEKAGRLKFNGQITGYSPLSRLQELEFAMAAVHSRRGLWMTLADARYLYPSLDAIPMEALITGCDDQSKRLQRLHSRAARAMLKAGRPTAGPGGHRRP